MTQFRHSRIAAALLLLVAGTIGFAVAQAQQSGDSSDDCAGWVFYPEPVGSSRYDGFLLCPSSGELWHVQGATKKLVREKE